MMSPLLASAVTLYATSPSGSPFVCGLVRSAVHVRSCPRVHSLSCPEPPLHLHWQLLHALKFLTVSASGSLRNMNSLPMVPVCRLTLSWPSVFVNKSALLSLPFTLRYCSSRDASFSLTQNQELLDSPKLLHPILHLLNSEPLRPVSCSRTQACAALCGYSATSP